jgi:hypothetical protein
VFAFEFLLGSQFSLVANQGRGSVNRSPQGAIRGGFAVSALVSAAFARRRVARVLFAPGDGESAAAVVSPAADKIGALAPSAGVVALAALGVLRRADKFGALAPSAGEREAESG